MVFKNKNIVSRSHIKHELRIARNHGSVELRGVLFGDCAKFLKKID
jgi:hypothetical protein